MRTNERSYLSAVGFDDADRRKPLHDMGCLYLAQPDKVEKLLCLVQPDRPGAEPGIARVNAPISQRSFNGPSMPRPIAFMDVLISWRNSHAVVVEVKTTADDFANTLGQLNYYRELTTASSIVLACFQPLDGAQKLLLSQHNYTFICLDSKVVGDWYKSHLSESEEAPF